MKRSPNKRLIISGIFVLAATLLAFSAHVFLQSFQNSIIAKRGEELSRIEMLRFPYPWHINVMGAVTAIVPTLIYFILFFMIWDKLPLRSWISKGIPFCLFILEIKGELFRNVIMGILVGNPVWVSLVSRLDIWIPNFLLGITCAAGVHYLKETHETKAAQRGSADRFMP